MRSSSFPLSPKYIDFIKSTKNVTAEFLEGTTASGKTTVGAGVKFMLMVSASSKKLHVIAAKTTGKAEETIINQDNGILDLHSSARYFGNGDKQNKIPHIKFEDKIIYVLGYDNKDKWQMALGAQFGCVYIDEINTADIDFVREISTRNDYLMATLNPDDPSLPVYKKFVNRSRPYKKYASDVPKEIMQELKEEPVPNWRYWFFSFKDNLSLTPDVIERKKTAALRMTDDVYRQTVNRVQLAMAAGETTLNKAIDMATQDFLDKGINCIVYSDGRRVNIADYVRMALRTTATRSTLQGQAKRFAEIGYDTVLVSEYGGCSKTCEPWQGQVYIDDVFTMWEGEHDEFQGKSNYCGEWFWLLSYAVKNGLFHPNCRHTLTQYIHGDTSIPKPIPAEIIEKHRKLEQKQRAMERKIRKLKRFAEGTCNPATAKAYRNKLREAQHELKAFVDKHNDVLRRDYSREKYYGEAKNQSKQVDIFNDYGISENSPINAEQIINDLSQTPTGQETLETLKNLPQRARLSYDYKSGGVRGEEIKGVVNIYLSNCKDVKTAACSVIHECTHYKYGIGNCQWAESVCVAKELMHRREREYLTVSEKRNIIKAVKEAYNDFSWKKGGTRHGRSISKHK